MSRVVKQLKTSLSVLFHFFIWCILTQLEVHSANVQNSKHTHRGSSWWITCQSRLYHSNLYIMWMVRVDGWWCEEYSICEQNIASWEENDLLEGTNEQNMGLWKWLMSFCVMKEDHSWLSQCKWMTSCAPHISVQHTWIEIKSCKFSRAIKKLNMAA